MSPSSAFTARRACHLLLSAGVLSASVLAGSLAPDAHAGTGACTSEPIMENSNGTTLDATTFVGNPPLGDTPSDVQNVNYSVTLPNGVSPVGQPVDNQLLGPTDTYSFKSTNQANTYTVCVQVKTGTQQNVTASLDLVSAKKVLSSSSASGHNSQQLCMTVTG